MPCQKNSKRMVLVALIIAMTPASGATAFVPDGASAENHMADGLRVIQEDELMPVDGKDVFLHNSGTLYALQLAGNLPFGMDIMYTLGMNETMPDALENTAYPIVHREVYDTGLAEPFGIEAGMTAETLLSLLPDAAEEDVKAEDESAEYHPWYYYRVGYENGGGMLYTYAYQDKEGKKHTIEAYCFLDMVSCYSVFRNDIIPLPTEKNN